MQRYVDTVNLMAYDYYEPGSDPISGHHAPLYTDPADPKKVSADTSVQAFERAGVPAAKILLGLPFYGHAWGQVADHQSWPLSARQASAKPLCLLQAHRQFMLNQGYIRYWDASSSVPYLYSADKQIFVSYEDPESIAAKCSYVFTHKLGGVMFWDYESDPSGTLLHAVDNSLHPPTAKDAK